MSFVEQDDVFAAVEPVIGGVFEEFTDQQVITPFRRITFADAMLKYGPISLICVFRRNQCATETFRGSGFQSLPMPSKKVSCPCCPRPGLRQPFGCRSHECLGAGRRRPRHGLYHFREGEARGPVAKALGEDKALALKAELGLADGDAVFFACAAEADAASLAGKARVRIGDERELRTGGYEFCWIVDFPMFEKDETTGQIIFSHNPFSMPQGGLDALENMDPLEIKAWQYDLVCNGVERSSGAIRNHLPEVMYKAFEIAGYGPEVVDNKFPA